MRQILSEACVVFKILVSLMLCSAVFAGAKGIVKETVPKGTDKPVKKLLAKYREQNPVKIKLRKKLKSPYKAEVETYEGLLHIKSDKLRMQIMGDKASLTVSDGKYIWHEINTEKNGKSFSQVTKLKLTEQRKNSAILSLLFTKDTELKAFRFVKVSGEKSERTYLYHPTNENADYQDLKIVINEEDGVIVALSFLDDLDNEESYRFGVTEFKAKVKNKLFTYKPPPGADVNEI